MTWLDKILNRIPEKRNYTDMVTAYHWDRVTGREYQALCAVEACVSLISNCFALASFKPSVPGLPTSEQLTEAVRAMLLRGESLWYISVKKGQAKLVQSSAWDISGNGYDPSSWRYDIQLPAPNGVAVKKGVPSAGVIHLRYSTNPEAPWRGVSPLTRGKTGISLLGLVEKSLTAENRLPSSIAIPIMRENITKERTNSMIDALNQSDGSVLLWDSPVAQVRADDKGASFTSGRLRPEPSVASMATFLV